MQWPALSSLPSVRCPVCLGRVCQTLDSTRPCRRQLRCPSAQPHALPGASAVLRGPVLPEPRLALYFLTPRARPSSLFLTLSTVQALAGPGPPAVSCSLLVPSCPSSWHSMHLTRGHVQLGPADWADGSMNCDSRLLFSGHESLRTREAGSKKLMSWMKKERTSFTSVFIAVVG